MKREEEVIVLILHPQASSSGIGTVVIIGIIGGVVILALVGVQ